MNVAEKEKNVFEIRNYNLFIETILIPACILKTKRNKQGDITDFIVEAINDEAALALAKHKESLIGTKFFGTIKNKSDNLLFEKLCFVENSGLSFYRNGYSGYPLNRLNNVFRIKAVKYNDIIFLNWFDSSLADKLSGFAEKNTELRRITKEQSIALHESEELREIYRILGNTIPYGGWMADKSGRILYVSDSFLELFGSTQEEVTRNGWITFLPDFEIQKIKPLWESSLKNKEIFNAEFEIIGRDNTVHSILSAAHPVFNKNGEVRYWVGIHLNNDEQKKIKSKLNELVKKLKESNEELQQFAYVASHDLQEPLRMVASFTQLLERRYKDKLDKDGLDFINFAVDGANRMKNLIDGLLSYSRITTHSRPPAPVDLQKLVDNVIGSLNLIDENNAVIIYDNLPVISGDKNQIFQLFQNLIINGVKYRREEKPVIKITADKENSNWLFKVSDNGIGIEKKFFEKIFVVFQRLNSREKYEGTGIGLSVCKRIIERMGGKIWVDSEINKGSTFYFTLPERNNNVK